MGSSLSVPRSPDSALKQQFSSSPDYSHELSISSPIKEKTLNREEPASKFGSEEIFFDSQAWLDSDSEDDFVSQKGDFTPSSSNTPIHHNSLPNPQLTKYLFIDRAPYHLSIEHSPVSPTDNKKRLSEFLEESIAGKEIIEDKQTTPDELDMSAVQHPKSANRISYPFPFLSKSYSVRSRDRTPNRYLKPQKAKEKAAKPTGCCLPSLPTSLSFSEKRRRW